MAYEDAAGQAWLRLFVDLDGDGRGATPGESWELAGPADLGSAAGVGWLDASTLLLAGNARVFRGELDEDFAGVSWTELEGLPGEEAGNAFLAGFVTPDEGESWGLFDLPWTPQLVRLDDTGLQIQSTLPAGNIGDGERSLARVRGRWLVADPSGEAVWDFGEDFDQGSKLIDASSDAWESAGLESQPAELIALRGGRFVVQDGGESAFIYVMEDLDGSGSIDPESEVDVLIEPGACHRARPGHLAALGERLLWVDDCDGSVVQEQPGEVTEQKAFTLPSAVLLPGGARSVGISGWDADCVGD